MFSFGKSRNRKRNKPNTSSDSNAWSARRDDETNRKPKKRVDPPRTKERPPARQMWSGVDPTTGRRTGGTRTVGTPRPPTSPDPRDLSRRPIVSKPPEREPTRPIQTTKPPRRPIADPKPPIVTRPIQVAEPEPPKESIYSKPPDREPKPTTPRGPAGWRRDPDTGKLVGGGGRIPVKRVYSYAFDPSTGLQTPMDKDGKPIEGMPKLDKDGNPVGKTPTRIFKAQDDYNWKEEYEKRLRDRKKLIEKPVETGITAPAMNEWGNPVMRGHVQFNSRGYFGPADGFYEYGTGPSPDFTRADYVKQEEDYARKRQEKKEPPQTIPEPPEGSIYSKPDRPIRDIDRLPKQPIVPKRPTNIQPDFYNSPEYKEYSQYRGPATTDTMYNSPYFGQGGSSSRGRMLDRAYEAWAGRTDNEAIPQSSLEKPEEQQKPWNPHIQPEFYNSPEYKKLKQQLDQPNMQYGQAVHYSPYFGQFGSTVGGSWDSAYKAWAERTGNELIKAPRSDMFGFLTPPSDLDLEKAEKQKEDLRKWQGYLKNGIPKQTFNKNVGNIIDSIQDSIQGEPKIDTPTINARVLQGIKPTEAVRIIEDYNRGLAQIQRHADFLSNPNRKQISLTDPNMSPEEADKQSRLSLAVNLQKTNFDLVDRLKKARGEPPTPPLERLKIMREKFGTEPFFPLPRDKYKRQLEGLNKARQSGNIGQTMYRNFRMDAQISLVSESMFEKGANQQEIKRYIQRRFGKYLQYKQELEKRVTRLTNRLRSRGYNQQRIQRIVHRFTDRYRYRPRIRRESTIPTRPTRPTQEQQALLQQQQLQNLKDRFNQQNQQQMQAKNIPQPETLRQAFGRVNPQKILGGALGRNRGGYIDPPPMARPPEERGYLFS